MGERFGWSIETWFGQFMSVATALIAVALVSVSACDFLIDRYQWKLAHGEIRYPDTVALSNVPLNATATLVPAGIPVVAALPHCRGPPFPILNCGEGDRPKKGPREIAIADTISRLLAII